jgi:carbamoyl-phosphate synthase large subunit
MDLHKAGHPEKYGVEMIGAKPDAIAKGEDRELFKQAMVRSAWTSPRRRRCNTLGRGAGGRRRHRPSRDHPAELHAGRQGGGIAYNREEFDRIVGAASTFRPVHEVLSRSASSAGRNSRWR